MSSAMTGSPAAISQNNFMTGVELALYANPNDSNQRYLWDQIAPTTSDYLKHEPRSSGANQKDIMIEGYTYMDRIFTLYVVMHASAISGERGTDTRGYMTDRHPRLRKADRAAMQLYNREEEQDMGYTDASAIMDGLMRSFYGTSGNARRQMDFEFDDASSVRTEETRDPSRQKYYAYRIEGWPYEMIFAFMIVIGSLVLDLILGRFMFIYHDLSVTETRKVGLREVTAQAPDRWASPEDKRIYLIERSSMDEECWVPIPLWCTLCVEMALNIFAWDWSPVEFHIETSRWTNVIKRYNRYTHVVNSGGHSVKDSDLQLYMVVHALHIDNVEREQILMHPFDALIHQHHHRREDNFKNTTKYLDVRFHQPTIALHIVVQRKAAVRDLRPNWYWGLFDRAPIKTMAFFFNHQQRQAEMSEIFYRYIMALEKHTALPTICVYTMGFAYQIESPWPTNSANMIRYTSSTARIELQPYLGQVEGDPICVWVFQTNWMILKTNDGVAIPIFNNSVSLASARA